MRKQNLDREVEVKEAGTFEILWYGFNSSVILNKKTNMQEFVSNSSIGMSNRMRHTFKFR